MSAHARLGPRSTAGRRQASGFSLVELLVAVTLGLFLVIGLLSLIVSSSVSRTELDKSSRQIENGRFALATLTEDIEHAGFTGATVTTTSGTVTQVAPTLCPSTLLSVADKYTAASNYVAQVPFSIYGAAASTLSCLDHPVTSGTTPPGVIVVSRVSTNSTTVTAVGTTSTVMYLQPSTCASETTPFTVAAPASASGFTAHGSNCTTAAPLRTIMQRIYYVSSCNVCSPTNDGQPTLKVAEYDASGAATITPLVEGIEDLQFDFGVDADNNGSPDSYVSAASVTSWANVVTVRIHVLARNEDPSSNWTDTRTYDMGVAEGTRAAANDKYKRHVYTGVARLYNVSGQRELQ